MSISTMFAAAIVVALGSSPVVATQVIRAGDRVSQTNSETAEGALADATLLGREVVRTVYAGQEVNFDNTRAPRLVTRNQTVTVKYISGALEITTTGRAMGEASLNEPVTVLNPQSRQLVHGIVQENGWVLAQ